MEIAMSFEEIEQLAGRGFAGAPSPLHQHKVFVIINAAMLDQWEASLRDDGVQAQAAGPRLPIRVGPRDSIAALLAVRGKPGDLILSLPSFTRIAMWSPEGFCWLAIMLGENDVQRVVKLVSDEPGDFQLLDETFHTVLDWEEWQREGATAITKRVKDKLSRLEPEERVVVSVCTYGKKRT